MIVKNVGEIYWKFYDLYLFAGSPGNQHHADHEL